MYLQIILNDHYLSNFLHRNIYNVLVWFLILPRLDEMVLTAKAGWNGATITVKKINLEKLIISNIFFQPIINIFCGAEIPVTGSIYPDIINFIAVIF